MAIGPPDTETRFRELTAALKEHAFRLTPQRVELVRLIADSKGHPNASQLYEQIRDRFPTMSPATVYKTLALLKNLNQVLEIDLEDERHYDGRQPAPHAHLICTKCSKIADGDLHVDRATIRRLEKATGYRIAGPQFTFYGLCPACRRRSP